MRKIIHYVLLHAPAEPIYEALTTEPGLAGWWTPTVHVEGDLIRFTFLPGFNPEMRVVSKSRPQGVEWRCAAGHDNWLDDSFSFNLTPKGADTGLLFTQVYTRQLDMETYGTYNFNWGYYLNSLKRFCETGAGNPYEAA